MEVSTISIQTQTEPEAKKQQLTIEEKRVIIQRQLDTNFPAKTVFFTGIIFVIVGYIEMGLHLALCVYLGIYYKVGHGIWGGFFCIVNGLIKFNLYAQRSYSSYVLLQAITPPVGIIMSVALVSITGASISKYPCDTMPNCSRHNKIISEIMLAFAHIAVINNLISIFIIKNLLFGGCKKSCTNDLGCCQVYKELKYICCGHKNQEKVSRV